MENNKRHNRNGSFVSRFTLEEGMKKVLLLLVGGTICTAINEKGNLSVHEKTGISASLLTNRLMCISHLPCIEKERMRQFTKLQNMRPMGIVFAFYMVSQRKRHM